MKKVSFQSLLLALMATSTLAFAQPVNQVGDCCAPGATCCTPVADCCEPGATCCTPDAACCESTQ